MVEVDLGSPKAGDDHHCDRSFEVKPMVGSAWWLVEAEAAMGSSSPRVTTESHGSVSQQSSGSPGQVAASASAWGKEGEPDSDGPTAFLGWVGG